MARRRSSISYQRGRTREKVSIVAALSVSPQRGGVGFYFSLRPNANVTTSWLIAFLGDLVRHLRNPILIVWDRLPGHRARSVTHFLHRRPRLQTLLLPPYAPELNPVEVFWSYLKQNPLANLAAPDATPLAHIARKQTRQLRRRQDLLRSFIRATPLFLSQIGH